MFDVSAINQLDATFISLALFLLFIAVCRLGFLVKKKALEKGIEDKQSGLAALEGSLLGLLALLLAFTFGMSASRHDRRLSVIVEEANDIGTAILRADLYPDSMRKASEKILKHMLKTGLRFMKPELI